MFSSLPRTSNLAYTYSGILIIMMMGFFLPPYLSIIRDFCHLQLTTNYTLPGSLGVGYFWTIPNNYLYHFHLFFETYSGTLSAITACSMDSLFCLYVYQLTSTMNVMSFRIMNLLPSEEFPDILKTCLTKHQKLLQCRDTLEHVYGVIIFWHIVTNAVVLCAMIYQTLTVHRYINIKFNFRCNTLICFVILNLLLYVITK